MKRHLALSFCFAMLAGLWAASSASAVTLDLRPKTSADDAEEKSSGSVSLTSSDVELVVDGTAQVIGIRWTGVTIPVGATITSAYIQFSAKEAQSEATTLTIRGQLLANPATFTTGSKNITLRTRTTAAVTWSPAAWTAGQTTAAQQTPGLAGVISEIVGQSGWASDNALVIIINGTGHRTAYAFDGAAAKAPLLHIEYSTGPPLPPLDLAPVAKLTLSKPSPTSMTVTADGSGSTDADLTPIATYTFDFGDGPAVSGAAATATHTYTTEGPHAVTLIATDTGGKPSALVSASITLSKTVTATFDARIAASSDDAEEQPSGSVSLTSGDLELIHDSNDQIVGIRWPNVTIPAGATIVSAWVQFGAKVTEPADATSLKIYAQGQGDAATFQATSKNITERERTAQFVTWQPGPWTAGQAVGPQQTPDLAAVIQEAVDHPSWAGGNGLAIIITGTGRRTAYSYDGNKAQAPLLHVEYTVGPPPERPPVARLSLTKPGPRSMVVTADASASTDIDTHPIATYTFDFGDGTLPVTQTSPICVHTYAADNTYNVSLYATDTGGSQSSTVTVSIVVSQTGPTVRVYAGYYDTHHPGLTQPKPNPWMGSPNVVFVGKPDGSSGGWDSSCMRVENQGTTPLTNVVVTCNIGSKSYALWATQTIPPGYSLILAQTSMENFDGSDTNPAGCYGCSASDCASKVQHTIPVIHVSIGGVKTDYNDVHQVINTRGVDGAGCPATGTRNDESHPWDEVFPAPPSPAQASREREVSGIVPLQVALAPPSPNPTRGNLTFRFETPVRGLARLSVFDLNGRLVRTCVDGVVEAGYHDARVDLAGVPAGVYFATLATAQGTRKGMFVLMK